MKNLLKIAALILILALTSCSTAPQLLPFISEITEDSDLDFGGREFVIKSNWYTQWDPLVSEDSSSSARTAGEDAIIAHNAKVMQDYNCKIKSVFCDWSYSESLAANVMAYNVDFDLLDTNLSFMIDHIKKGFCYSWEDAGVDVSDTAKYGPAGFLDMAAYKGQHYGVWSNYRSGAIGFDGVMGVNNNILGQFTDVKVYELYENERWTFDEFKDLLHLFASDESIIPLSYYEQRLFTVCSILSNGSNLVFYDESRDKYIYGMNDPKAVRALEYVKSLYEEKLVREETDYDDYFNVHQNAAFTITSFWCIGGNIDGMDVICFPFGPDAEYGKDFGAYRSTSSRYLFMPITADPVEVGKFTNVWLEELEENPKANIVENLKINDFFNDNSANMYMELNEKAAYDYSFELNDVYNDYCNAMTKAVFSNSSIYEFISANEDKVQSVIDDELNS